MNPPLKLKKVTHFFYDFIGKDALEVLKHAKNYFTAGFISNGLGFVTLPIFTRLLTPDEYGIISIFLSIISIFAVILGLNLHFFVFRYYHEKTDDYDQLIGTILIFLIFFNLSIFPLIFVFREQLAFFFQVQSTVFLFAMAVSFLTAIKEILLLHLRTSLQSFKHSVVTVLLQFFILSLSILVIYFMEKDKFLGRIYGEFFVTLIFSVYFFYELSSVSKFRWNSQLLKKAMVYSLPLIPHTLSNHVLSQFDRIIINQLKGATAAGLYSFAYKIGSIMYLFIMGVTKAWSPIFFKKMKKEDYRGINTVLNKYSKLLYFLAICLILFAKEMVMLLSDKEYHEALKIVPIIILSHVFLYLYTAFSQYTVYIGKTALFAANTIAAGIVNVALNYLLIPHYGYMIAGFTTLASYMLLSCLHYITAKHILKIKNIIPLRLLLPDLVYIVIATLLFYFVENTIQKGFVSFFIRLMFVAFLAFFIWGRRILNKIKGVEQ